MLDTHCHIDLYKNPETVLAICEKNKIVVFSMTNLPSHFELGLPHFKNKKYVRQALGLHPLNAELHNIEFPKFIKNFSKTSYIGEIGLDFSKEGIVTKTLQLKSFEKILQLVMYDNKILSLHSRKAENEVLELLLKYKIQNAIFHWYSGSLGTLQKIVDSGYYFSINPAMIKSIAGQKIISRISRNLILLETDGPFIKNVNKVPLNPGEIDDVILYLASLWNLSINEVRTIVKSNFARIMNNIKNKKPLNPIR